MTIATGGALVSATESTARPAPAPCRARSSMDDGAAGGPVRSGDATSAGSGAASMPRIIAIGPLGPSPPSEARTASARTAAGETRDPRQGAPRALAVGPAGEPHGDVRRLGRAAPGEPSRGGVRRRALGPRARTGRVGG